jgi:hypothetical protein
MKSLLVVITVVAFFSCPVQAYPRTWTDATGKYTVEAELVEVTEDDVVLTKSDGKTITVPISKLSKADQEFLQEQSRPKEEPKAADEPAEDDDSNADLKKKTFEADKKLYFISTDVENPAKSRKLAGLAPTPVPWLPIPVDFTLAPSHTPVDFKVRMKIRATDEDSGEPVNVVFAVSLDEDAGKKKGRTAAIFMPTKYEITGKGDAVIDLIKDSADDIAKAESLSNTLVVPFIIED